MVPILFAAGGAILLILLWIGGAWIGRSSERKRGGTASVPADISLNAQPLLTKSEAAFYNVLRLAVQDEYLVFAQIPLWCLIEVTATDHKARVAFLAQIALKRVDFVLVHPGSLTVVKVIELEDDAQPSSQRLERNRLIDNALQKAGIEIVRLPRQTSYTVPEMAALLDIEPME
jgi:hypothetical protein